MTRRAPLAHIALGGALGVAFAGSLASPIGAQRSAGHIELRTLFDSAYQRQRRIWIYTPAGYDAHAASAYPLLVAFDGADYQRDIPLPRILDSLVSARRVPAMVAVLVDDSAGAARIADLGNSPRMTRFLARQLVPYVRAGWRVTTDPHRVIVTGSSAGGLAATFVALERPDLFGNVLSQSGAFWRGTDASNGPPYEWLASRVAAMPKRDVTLLLDVGALETRATLGGSGPVFIDANRRFHAVLVAKGYHVTYTEVPGGQHAPQYWKQRLPADLVTLTSDWPR